MSAVDGDHDGHVQTRLRAHAAYLLNQHARLCPACLVFGPNRCDFGAAMLLAMKVEN